MKMITSFEATKDLPIPQKVKNALRTELMRPFDSSESIVCDFWKELGCALLCLEGSDSEASLLNQQPLADQLHALVHYPEWVITLQNRYLLALTITNDEGGGFYLLAPLDLPLPFINQLKRSINNSINHQTRCLMARKPKAQTSNETTQSPANTSNQASTESLTPILPTTNKGLPENSAKASNEVSNHTPIITQAKALKLSPKTDKHVFYDITKDEAGELLIRLAGNEGGGLHSQEWIKVSEILDILDKQKDKPFKSTLLKPLFKSTSANNAGFLCAVLRSQDIKLIQPAGNNLYLHELTPDYDECRELMLSLANTDPA